MVATNWGVGQALLTIIWIALFFIWIMLLFNVLTDIFRSHDIGGGVKALWIVLIVVFPYIGVLAYVLLRGHKMSEHALEAAHNNQAAVDAYIRHTAGSSPADEIAKLHELKEKGAISDAEFEQMKSKIVSSV
jgi:hypothetical protein